MHIRTLLSAALATLLLAFTLQPTPLSAQRIAMNYQAAYVSVTVYQKGDTIQSAGTTYVSLISNNTGNTPASNPADWAALATGYPGVTSTGTGSLAVSGSITGPVGFGFGCVGDSRPAGSTVAAGQDLCTKISLQPQFAGYGAYHNGAVGNSTCNGASSTPSMTALFSTNMLPYIQASPTSTFKLVILEGINSADFQVPFATWELCYSTYINTAIAAGAAVGVNVVPILITPYYSSLEVGISGAEAERLQMGDWITSLPYISVDSDLFFAPLSSNPQYGIVAGGNTESVTGYSIASGVITVTGTGVTVVGQTVGQVETLSQFPSTSSCLYNTFLTATVLTTGNPWTGTLSGYCPNVTSSTDTGYAQYVQSDPTHLGPAGINLLAKEVNEAVGLAMNGTTMRRSPSQDYWASPSKQYSFMGSLYISAPGGIHPYGDQLGNLGVASGTAAGCLSFGSDSQWSECRGGTGTTFTTPGAVTFNMASGNNFAVNGPILSATSNTQGTNYFGSNYTNYLNSTSSCVSSGTSATAVVTITIASPAVVSVTNTCQVGQQLNFTTTGALPTGLSTGVPYYIIATGLSTSGFEVSTTLNGSAVNTSGTQSGTQSMVVAVGISLNLGAGNFSVNSYIVSGFTSTSGSIYFGTGLSSYIFANSGGMSINAQGAITANQKILATAFAPTAGSGRKGTFSCTAAGTITIANTNEITTSDVLISMQTAGGTITTPPAMKTVTGGTGFTVLCGATDTSVYNYDILN